MLVAVTNIYANLPSSANVVNLLAFGVNLTEMQVPLESLQVYRLACATSAAAMRVPHCSYMSVKRQN